MSIDELAEQLRSFARARDWEQFHSPKNLAMALASEAGELLELFQWLTEEQSTSLVDSPADIANVRRELADVFIYLIRLADRLDIDLEQAAADKIEENARKYPVEKARGKSTKYRDL